MTLTNEEVLALREFLSHQYVPPELTRLFQRLDYHIWLVEQHKKFDELVEEDANAIRNTKEY